MKTRLALKVRAGARRTEFSGTLGRRLETAGRRAAGGWQGERRDHALPGEAAFGSASSVRIVTGLTSPAKIVEIEGVDAEQLERAILESHGPRSHTGSSAPGKA